MYPSKILLFGEYTILTGSQALAVPYFRYTGEWAFPSGKSDHEEAESSNAGLKKLADYLKLTDRKSLEYLLDISSFEKELEEGLFFKSNIPKGSGLGSSGALAAAVFSRYSNAGTSEPDLNDLRISLASIESYYHGTSSGIDPLVSFLKSPVYFQNNEKFACIAFPDHELQKSGLFVVNGDSLKNKDTRTLVTHFKRKYNSDKGFSSKLKTQYLPVNDKCIQSLTRISFNNGFFDTMKKLTKLQLDFFIEMIPEKLIPVINHGLSNELFYMKLCGSGGGGFMLGFTSDISGTKRFFEDKLIPIQIYGEEYQDHVLR